MSERMSVGVDQYVILHRNEAGEFIIEQRPDPDDPGREKPIERVVTYAREALDGVKREIASFKGSSWEGEEVSALRREQEFLEDFLRVHSA